MKKMVADEGREEEFEIASAATPLAVTGPETLSAATPAGPLHLGGVISGEGGLAKTGSGPLYLYRENPFSGAFTADGNGVTPTGDPDRRGDSHRRRRRRGKHGGIVRSIWIATRRTGSRSATRCSPTSICRSPLC